MIVCSPEGFGVVDHVGPCGGMWCWGPNCRCFERMSTLKSCASVTILLLCGFSLNIDFHQKHHSPIHQLLTAGSYSLLKACSHVACWVEFLSPSLPEGWLGPTGADWPLWWDGDGADGMWSDTHMLMVVICSLIQYKDVILPVQEIPFWRWHLYIGSAPIPLGQGQGLGQGSGDVRPVAGEHTGCIRCRNWL